jgi:hypothetical protein
VAVIAEHRTAGLQVGRAGREGGEPRPAGPTGGQATNHLNNTPADSAAGDPASSDGVHDAGSPDGRGLPEGSLSPDPQRGGAGAAKFCVRMVLRLWLLRHRMPEEGTSGSVGGRSGHCRLYPAAEMQKRAAHVQRSAALN